MKTQAAIDRYMLMCKYRGLSPSTIRKYSALLKPLAEAYPELPTDMTTIEDYLQRRGEPPGHRRDAFKVLQTFYSSTCKAVLFPLPVLSAGPVGRPRKVQTAPIESAAPREPDSRADTPSVPPPDLCELIAARQAADRKLDLLMEALGTRGGQP